MDRLVADDWFLYNTGMRRMGELPEGAKLSVTGYQRSSLWVKLKGFC